MEGSMTNGLIDRRHFQRTTSGEHGILSARVRPGHLAVVIDVSAGGALVEISRRLLPGSSVDLQIDTMHRQSTVRGRIVRCAVCRIDAITVSYRAAIAFDRQWPLAPSPVDSGSGEYPIPAADPRPAPPQWVASTHRAV
jgi:PilZ domain-containing protein